MLTGEPTRAERGKGGRVLAGSENGLRAITIEAVQTGHNTVLDQVVALVGRAREARGDFQRATDRVFAWYVPLVLLIAVAVAAGWAAFGPAGSAITYAAVCAVGVLVVACPCAVGLTTVAAVIAMRHAAKAGVLFRDAVALERLALVDTVLFDKTGTLTEGRPRLHAVVPNTGLTDNAVLALAAAVERGSEHPIGLAIVWEAARRGVEIGVAESVEAVVGKGVRGAVNDRKVVVGRFGFLQESGVHSDLMVSEAVKHRHMGHVLVLVGEGTRCVGAIVFHDPLRAHTVEAIEGLRRAGFKLAMVTGDHAETARALARGLGIDDVDVIADALPVEKFAVVQKYKNDGHVVAMCGDGINDAPALGAADVGIAPASGTGAAIGTAGVTLAHADLRAIEISRELSRAAVRTIRWNLVLAFAFNVLAIPVAAGALVPFGGGLIDSFWAAAAIAVSSFAVLVNSFLLYLRLPSFAKLAVKKG
jgi:Cu+-exporting ATPase